VWVGESYVSVGSCYICVHITSRVSNFSLLGKHPGSVTRSHVHELVKCCGKRGRSGRGKD